MKIYLGSDHAGFTLKQKIKSFLNKKNIIYEDLGDFVKNEIDDYPDFVVPVARCVSRNKGARGIVIGGSGQGEAMAANKIKGIRAVVYYGGDLGIIRIARKHNNSNVLSLGARFLSEKKAFKAVSVWLMTPFSHSERHMRRLKKLENMGS